VQAGAGIVCVQTRGTPLGGGAYEGDVYCWGNNSHDTIGLPVAAGEVITTPNEIGGFAGDVVSLALSGDTRHACAVRHDGSVWCWGDDYQGRIGAVEGTGITGPGENGYCHPDPVEVRVDGDADAGADAGDISLGAPLGSATSVVVGDGTSCALRLDGSVWCWGNDNLGGLGDLGPYVGSQHPGARMALGLPSNVTGLSRHWYATFATDGAGAVHGWGDDTYRELAAGPVGSFGCDDAGLCFSPPVVLPTLAGAVSLASGLGSGLLQTANAELFAWGANEHGQLGHPPGTAGDTTCAEYGVTGACNATPVQVPLP
jgi:alpha-tubulin suppressor-like RCC1 family protein